MDIKESYIHRKNYCSLYFQTHHNIFYKLQNIFFRFLWNSKPDKIKRSVIIDPYETGGLKMPQVESFCKALKMAWINKLLDPLNIALWKTLY